MNEPDFLVLTGLPCADTGSFMQFDGEAHTRLEARATLLQRGDDTVVTIVGVTDVLMDGNLLVLE